jgi:predicted N-formylglutamate amidohydrolase
VGILFDPARAWESRVAGVLVDALRKAAFDARYNEPYHGAGEGLTSAMRRRFVDAAYAGIEVEVNEKLATAVDVRARVVEVLVRAIGAV